MICGNNKMKNKSLWKSFILLALFFVTCTGCNKERNWTLALINDYELRHIGEAEVILGKKMDGITETEKDGKQIGVEDYIAEFRYGENTIALKCLRPTEEGISLLFYIIDTKNEDVYGPYEDEETYEKVSEKIVEEELNDWIKTDPTPKGIKYE